MSKEQTPIERLEKKMQSFAMKSYQYNELNALIQKIKTEREQYAQAKVREVFEDISERLKESIMLEPARMLIEKEIEPKYK